MRHGGSAEACEEAGHDSTRGSERPSSLCGHALKVFGLLPYSLTETRSILWQS